MSTNLSDIKGDIYLVASVKIKEGRADEAAALLKKVQENCKSDAEPGCRLYEVMRFGNDFKVAECYTSREALEVTHRASEPYKALGASGVIESVTLQFYEGI